MVDFTRLKSTDIIYAIRLSISAEHEAIQLYEQIAEMSTDEAVKAIFTDIANEEKVHIGELMCLLNKLVSDEKGFVDKGINEALDKIFEIEQRTKTPDAPQQVSSLVETAIEPPQETIEEPVREEKLIEDKPVESTEASDETVEPKQPEVDKETRIAELKKKLLDPNTSIDEVLKLSNELKTLE